MEYNIKLIGLDLDGTVFNNQKIITPRTINAIEQAIEQGIVVLPATGRPYVGLPNEFLCIKGVQYALTANGASIIHLASNSVVYSDLLPVSSAIKAIETARTFDCLMDVLIDGYSYTSKKTIDSIEKYMQSPMMTEYFLKTRSFLEEDILDYITKHQKPVEKIQLLFKDLELKKQASQILSEMDELSITSALPNNIEINSSTANKGNGLLGLGQFLEIQQDEIMACGDSFNDYEMIKQAGLGVAMGNANKEIKTIADYITLSNDEEGVADVIEKILNKQALL